MNADRRRFLQQCGALATGAGAAALARPAAAMASAVEGSHHNRAPADPMGVLVDLSACVGCRLCEYACRKHAGIETGSLESYDDQSIMKRARRPAPDAFTVVNLFKPETGGDARPVYAKINCMHCNYSACVSACIVGALEKQENGAVTYDAWKCIGCRYCMVACPFQLPAYSYDDVLTPEVRKCQFCFDRIREGEKPACVAECPRQVMTFGKRNELIKLAHERIAAEPGKFVDHVYGEHEIGGTSWMYLSPIPFEQAGFLPLGTSAPPALTEAIQHGVFKYWIAPVGWYSFLASMMWWTGRRAKAMKSTAGVSPVADDAVELESTGQTPVVHREQRGASSVAVLEAPPVVRRNRISDLSSQPSNGNGNGHGAHHHNGGASLHDHAPAQPADRKLLTPGVWALIGMVLTGVAFGLYRFIVGLADSTNLDQQHPWGLWIAMDVGSGIALAGGGFVTAAVVHIFHREHYHAVARSALLTALLGYTFYVPGLLADIGRWYNIWHPTLPNMWQGNSVLFEVGICVMLYLNVQYAELAPIVCERLIGEKQRFPRLARLAQWAHPLLEKILPALLVLGVALSTFHQSSLGNLMVIAPYKLHELWWSPWSPLFFLLSAMMVGFPMVIFTLLFASWSLKRKPEMHVLAPLARRYVPVFLMLYLIAKIGDMVWRGTADALFAAPALGALWMIEIVGGVIAPMVLVRIGRVVNSPKWLALTMLAVILGVVLNRLNVFVIAYAPPYAEKSYFPSITEFAVSMGLVAALMLVYRIAVTYLPILQPAPRVKP